MNWEKVLTRGLPIAINVLREVFDGIGKGRSNDEIRRRAASPDVILDEQLDDLREAEDDLLDFVKTGE